MKLKSSFKKNIRKIKHKLSIIEWKWGKNNNNKLIALWKLQSIEKKKRNKLNTITVNRVTERKWQIKKKETKLLIEIIMKLKKQFEKK